MKHIHRKTGVEYEVGFLSEFDMCVITKWDTEHNYEKGPVIVGYYFGDYDKESTDYYIDQYLDKMEGLKDGLKFLKDEYQINCVDGNFMEPDQQKKLENSIYSVESIVNDNDF